VFFFYKSQKAKLRADLILTSIDENMAINKILTKVCTP